MVALSRLNTNCFDLQARVWIVCLVDPRKERANFNVFCDIDILRFSCHRLRSGNIGCTIINWYWEMKEYMDIYIERERRIRFGDEEKKWFFQQCIIDKGTEILSFLLTVKIIELKSGVSRTLKKEQLFDVCMSDVADRVKWIVYLWIIFLRKLSQ